MATEETSPTAAAGTQRLLHYWAHGAGRNVIQPGTPGAFDRCDKALAEHIPSEHIRKGWCARVIHEATGHWPGEHHGGDHKG